MSDNIFIHDPFTWFDHGVEPEEKEKRIKEILEQRATKGYAFYDWINFCDYYGTLFKKVSELIVNQTFPNLPQEAVNAAKRIISIAEEVTSLDNRIDSMGAYYEKDRDSIRNLMKQVASLEEEAVELFFTKILYRLPFVDDYEIPVADREDLLNVVDYESLGSFMMTVYRNGLIRMQKGASYPGKLDSPEQWETILQSIIDKLDVTGKEPLNKDTVETVVEYYLNLWD